MTFKLNNIVVDEQLLSLMTKPNWVGKYSTDKWFDKFQSHPNTKQKIPYVQLCSLEGLVRENKAFEKMNKTQLSLFKGSASESYFPGDIDFSKSYLIGFTDFCDAGIFVDLRPTNGPRIIYDNLSDKGVVYATAFNSINEFIQFFNNENV